MSSEKRVVSLFLLLIILIVSCVYYHAPKMVKVEDTNVATEPKKIAVIDEVEDENINNEIENLENNQKVMDESSKQIEENVEGDVEEIAVKQEDNKDPIVDNNPLENSEESIEKDKESQEVEQKVVEPLLLTGKKYIRKGDEKPIEQLSIKTQELQIRINDLVKEKPVVFNRAGYKTTKKSDITIKEIADILKEYPNIRIEIAGHTDAVGAAKMNQQISLARAKSVKNKIISFGIDQDRLVARGYGENIPLENTGGYSKINRRVEFNIIGE